MKFSFLEKYRYNQAHASHKPFSAGYKMGADLYLDYAKAGKDGQKQTHKIFNEFHALALQGDPFSKGILCGARDAANERKRK